MSVLGCKLGKGALMNTIWFKSRGWENPWVDIILAR